MHWYHIIQEEIKVFSNHDDGLLAWGKEEVVTNYMVLMEDPKGDWIISYQVSHLIG